MNAIRLYKQLALHARSVIFPLNRSWLVPVALVILSLAYAMGQVPLVNTLRNNFFDLYQVLAPRERVSGPVVIVEIDEESLQAVGQWPWPRSRLAELIERIGAMNPAAIGVDILMPEADRHSPCNQLQDLSTLNPEVLAQVCSQPSNDERLAQALRHYPTVLGVAGVEGPPLPPFKHTPVLIEGDGATHALRHFTSGIANLPQLHDAASGWGLISADMQRGIIRQVPMITSLSDQLIPSLSAEMLRLAIAAQWPVLVGSDRGAAGLRVGDLWLDTTASGDFWVNYSLHDPGRFVSAIDLLNGKVDPEQLAHRFVLIGFTGLGLVDYIATPLGERIPGVEVHAQVLETVFDGTTLARPDWAELAEAALLFVTALLVLYLLPRFRVWLQISTYTALLLAIGAFGLYGFKELRLLIDVASPTLFISLLFVGLLTETLMTGEEKIDDLEFKVRERTRQMTELQDVAMEAMGALAESRDPETGNHIRRTQHYIKLLAEYLSQSDKYAQTLTPETITHLFKTAPLHDIGKVGVPDHILLKPGKLTAEEFEQMKLHPEHGRRAIEAAERKMEQPSAFLQFAKEIIYGHHEKWDGSGYPQGLAGEAIPLSARLMAIADVYDALISRRCYKPPFPHEKAVSIIVEGRGSHFDPELVDAFLVLAEQFHAIAEQYADQPEDLAALEAASESIEQLRTQRA